MSVWHMRLLPLEVVAVGEVVGADVAGRGYDDELASGFQEVEVVAVFGLQLVEGGWVGDDGVAAARYSSAVAQPVSCPCFSKCCCSLSSVRKARREVASVAVASGEGALPLSPGANPQPDRHRSAASPRARIFRAFRSECIFSTRTRRRHWRGCRGRRGRRVGWGCG